MKTLSKIIMLLALATCASAQTLYAPATLALSCNAVTTTGPCTSMALPGNSLAIGVTWQLSYDTGTASGISVTLQGSNDPTFITATTLDTNTACVTTGGTGCSRSLTVTAYKYLRCNPGTWTKGSTSALSCGMTVNPNGGTAIGIHGTITPGDCTSWFNTTLIQDAGPCAAGGGTPSDATPNMDSGSGSAGTATTYARGDHTHPTDTSREAHSALATVAESGSYPDLINKPTLTRTACATDLAPVTGDDLLITLLDPATAAHLIRFGCGVTGTTSVVANLVKATYSLMADQTCTAGDANAVTTSTFVNGSSQCGAGYASNCAVAAHAPVTIHVGTISGTPTGLTVCVDYTVD
jgi:hypothetical protein